MKERQVACVVFYDEDYSIAVQERRTISKTGEVYGFWGGEIEQGETKESAIKRELEEELGYTPKKIEYWGLFSYISQEKGPWQGYKILQHIFLSPVTQSLLDARVREGDGIKVINLIKVIKGEGFPKGSTNFLKDLKDKLLK